MSARLIVPVKPFNAPVVMVDVSDKPTFAGEGEEAERLKSTTVTVIVAVVWDKDPLVPVTVTV